MAYTDHFVTADEIFSHLGGVVPALTDPMLALRYTGFATVSAVAVYEQAIKTIFIEFAEKKGRAFGNYAFSHFDRINGRIQLDTIKKDYVERFGERYLNRYKRNLEARADSYMQANRRDIRSSYSNIITWRNEFAHTSGITTHTTFLEATQAYKDGKEIIHCLAETMKR